MNDEPTIVDLIRHGEPVGGSKYRGWVDDPLSEKGWAQMRAAVEGRDGWTRIVSSDLSRCAAFAQEVGERLGLPVELDQGFREVAFGSWEGRSSKELMESDPEGTAAFWRDPVNNTPEGAEPLIAFRERVVGAWNRLLERHAGERVLLVGHAGMMRILLLNALEMPIEGFYHIDPRNAAMVRIRVDTGRHGEHYHQLVFPGPAV